MLCKNLVIGDTSDINRQRSRRFSVLDVEDTPTFSLLYRDEIRGYDFGIGHPFRGDRFRLFYNLLSTVLPPDNNYQLIPSLPATMEDLLLICDEDYIGFTTEYFGTGNLGNNILNRFSQYHSGDNYPSSTRPLMVENAARYIVGQAKTACNLIMEGQCSKAISIGGGLHHAKRAFGEGFCIYNDIAFCGRYLTDVLGLERVLILDTDAHAGNGTSEYFYDDPRVLFIDIHQDPDSIYPGTGFTDQTGEGKGKGYTINIPLPPGAGDSSFELAFDSVIMPVTEEFKPQVIIQNGGSDPHSFDEITNLNLSLDGFQKMGENISRMATICDNRLIGLITSGYNMAILPYVWLALISGLTGVAVDFGEANPEKDFKAGDPVYEETKQLMKEIKSIHQNTWDCLR